MMCGRAGEPLRPDRGLLRRPARRRRLPGRVRPSGEDRLEIPPPPARLPAPPPRAPPDGPPPPGPWRRVRLRVRAGPEDGDGGPGMDLPRRPSAAPLAVRPRVRPAAASHHGREPVLRG